MTIFGKPWAELTVDDIRRYLDQDDDEPVIWEAKGTKLDKHEVRREVCAFANGRESAT